MKLKGIVSIFICFVITLSSCTSFQRNFPRTTNSITTSQKEAIQNGLDATGKLMEFLEEAKFFTSLTKMASIIGPIFTVASIATDIAFLFIDIETEEMATLKREFTRLNNKLDKWSTLFDEVKREIEWATIKISYFDIENSITTLHADLNLILNSPKGMRNAQKEMFKVKYTSSLQNKCDILYQGFINTEAVISENLLLASQKYTQYHRAKVQNFMMSVFQLLLQGIQLQATYVKLEYNSTDASKFVESLWNRKIAVLQTKMQTIDTATKNQWSTQYLKDVDYLLSTHSDKSNQQFNQLAIQHFSIKYNWRNWLVVSYNQISGFNSHAVSQCQGTYSFRKNGRNLVVNSKDKQAYRIPNAQAKGDILLEAYSKIAIGKVASTIVQDLRTSLGNSCNEFNHVSAIKWGSGVWYTTSGGILAYKKICNIMFGSCYNTAMFG